jgi:hypothetical protein
MQKKQKIYFKETNKQRQTTNPTPGIGYFGVVNPQSPLLSQTVNLIWSVLHKMCTSLLCVAYPLHINCEVYNMGSALGTCSVNRASCCAVYSILFSRVLTRMSKYQKTYQRKLTILTIGFRTIVNLMAPGPSFLYLFLPSANFPAPP